jgi:arylsulfatase A-like enzyme
LDGKPGLYRKSARAYSQLTESDHKHATACYYALVTEIDGQFGKLMNKLKESGQLDNTVIIFTSDHGELLGAHGLYTKNISAMEEVYHIPMLAAGLNIAEGAVPDARVGLHDLYPTILELAGIDYEKVPDSASFAGLLAEPSSREAEFQQGYAEYHGGRTLVTQRVAWDGKWKYVLNGFDFDELYDLQEDPHELNNLIDDARYKEQLAQLSLLAWSKIRETNDHSLLNSHYISLRVFGPGPILK